MLFAYWLLFYLWMRPTLVVPADAVPTMVVHLTAALTTAAVIMVVMVIAITATVVMVITVIMALVIVVITVVMVIAAIMAVLAIPATVAVANRYQIKKIPCRLMGDFILLDKTRKII